jgi:hypothetical protein
LDTKSEISKSLTMTKPSLQHKNGSCKLLVST